MNKPVGGRGLKAIYDTTHSRIPIVLKPLVDALSDCYREIAIKSTGRNPIYTSICEILPEKLQREVILTALTRYIESQQSSPGGNQHRRKGEPLNIEKSRDWKHFVKFMKEIEGNDNNPV